MGSFPPIFRGCGFPKSQIPNLKQEKTNGIWENLHGKPYPSGWIITIRIQYQIEYNMKEYDVICIYDIYIYIFIQFYICTYTVTIRFHNPPPNLAGSFPLSISCFFVQASLISSRASFLGHKQDVYSSHLFKHLFNILEWQQRFCKWPTIGYHFLFHSTVGFVGCFQWSWFSRRWQKEPSSWRESGFTESWWLKGINSTDVWSQNQIY